MQRLRVLTTVRVLYYEALGAARIVELRGALARLVREAVGVTEELCATDAYARSCEATVEQVREFAERGETMPQKSTFFYPKLTSGLLFFPL